MSRFLLRAAELKKRYMQTPVDDMMSFFHTAVWAAAYGKDRKKSLCEDRLRNAIRDHYDHRDSTTSSVLVEGTLDSNDYSDTILTLIPFLSDWHKSLQDLARSALVISKRQEQPDAISSLLDCHIFAFQGVAALVKALDLHRDEIENRLA